MKLIAGLGNPGAKYLLTRHNIGFMAIDILAEAAARQQQPSPNQKTSPKTSQKSRQQTETAPLGLKKSLERWIKSAIAGAKAGQAPKTQGPILHSPAQGPVFKKERQSLTMRAQISGEPALLAKPQAFMNLSGRPIRDIMDFYKIPLDGLLVIQDDKDLPFQAMKFQKSRGHGGHNGIRDIHDRLGSNGYARLKLGIGPPSGPPSGPSSGAPGDFTQPDSGARAARRQTPGGAAADASPRKAPAPGPALSRYEPDPGRWGAAPELRKTAVDYVLSPFSQEEMAALPDFLQKAAEAVSLFMESGFEKAAGRFNQKNPKA